MYVCVLFIISASAISLGAYSPQEFTWVVAAYTRSYMYMYIHIYAGRLYLQSPAYVYYSSFYFFLLILFHFSLRILWFVSQIFVFSVSSNASRRMPHPIRFVVIGKALCMDDVLATPPLFERWFTPTRCRPVWWGRYAPTHFRLRDPNINQRTKVK